VPLSRLSTTWGFLTAGSVARRSPRLALAAVLCGVVVVSLSPSEAKAQARASGPVERGGPASWPTRPTVTFGNIGHVELGARVQTQFMTGLDPLAGTTGTADEGFGLQRARTGLAGRLGRVEFQAEQQLGERHPWRDLFADVKVSRALHVRAGHFKVPFSREQLTSMYEGDFTHRSAVVDELVPLRSTGVMLHGQVVDRAVTYQVGAFDYTARPRFRTDRPVMLSGRVTVAPFEQGRHRGSDTLQLSAAWLRRPLKEGQTGPEGRMVTGETFLPSVYARGTRTLVGGGAVWHIPVATIAGELMQGRDTREGQSLAGRDLSDLVTRGGYTSGAWHVVHGKGRRRGASPVRELDVTGRVDWVRFESAGSVGLPSRSPRADVVAPAGKRTVTLGVTWWLNRWMAVHTNAIRERVADPLGAYGLDTRPRWVGVVRSQVVM
jgi:phosphate-selective porin